jgi:anti-anti-sigma factor
MTGEADRPVVAVPLHGELDVGTIAGMRTALLEAVQANPGAVIGADMSEVTFADSTALGVLVAAHKQAATTGGCLRVLNPSDPVRRVLAITGLNKIFC